MHESAERAAAPGDLGKIARSIHALLGSSFLAELLEQGGRMALKPILLSFFGVLGLMPKLNNDAAVDRSARDACAQDGNYKCVVAAPVLDLVDAPGDRKWEQFSGLEGRRCALSVSAMRACQSCTSAWDGDVQGSVSLEEFPRDAGEDTSVVNAKIAHILNPRARTRS